MLGRLTASPFLKAKLLKSKLMLIWSFQLFELAWVVVLQWKGWLVVPFTVLSFPIFINQFECVSIDCKLPSVAVLSTQSCLIFYRPHLLVSKFPFVLYHGCSTCLNISSLIDRLRSYLSWYCPFMAFYLSIASHSWRAGKPLESIFTFSLIYDTRVGLAFDDETRQLSPSRNRRPNGTSSPEEEQPITIIASPNSTDYMSVIWSGKNPIYFSGRSCLGFLFRNTKLLVFLVFRCSMFRLLQFRTLLQIIPQPEQNKNFWK